MKPIPSSEGGFVVAFESGQSGRMCPSGRPSKHTSGVVAHNFPNRREFIPSPK